MKEKNSSPTPAKFLVVAAIFLNFFCFGIASLYANLAILLVAVFVFVNGDVICLVSGLRERCYCSWRRFAGSVKRTFNQFCFREEN